MKTIQEKKYELNDDNMKLRILLYLLGIEEQTQQRMMTEVKGLTGNWQRIVRILNELCDLGWIKKNPSLKYTKRTYYNIQEPGKKIVNTIKNLEKDCPELWNLRTFNGINAFR